MIEKTKRLNLEFLKKLSVLTKRNNLQEHLLSLQGKSNNLTNLKKAAQIENSILM